MAIIRRKADEIQLKIVYYGPGRCGKTTNLTMIHKAVGKRARGDLISITTAGDRTIFFDFLPMDLGSVRGMNMKISVYTVPGQVMYNATRKLVLRGADGVVFVADSQEALRKDNIESLQNLESNLLDTGGDLSNLPLVLQYNKRDLNGSGPPTMSIEEMERELNPESKWRSFQASALYGHGVRETFKQICIETAEEIGRQILG